MSGLLPIGYGYKNAHLVVTYLDSTRAELKANNETDSQQILHYFGMILKENEARMIKAITPYSKNRSMDIVYDFKIREGNIGDLNSRIESTSKLVKEAKLFVSGEYSSPEELKKPEKKSLYRSLSKILFR